MCFDFAKHGRKKVPVQKLFSLSESKNRDTCSRFFGICKANPISCALPRGALRCRITGCLTTDSILFSLKKRHCFWGAMSLVIHSNTDGETLQCLFDKKIQISPENKKIHERTAGAVLQEDASRRLILFKKVYPSGEAYRSWQRRGTRARFRRARSERCRPSAAPRSVQRP